MMYGFAREIALDGGKQATKSAKRMHSRPVGKLSHCIAFAPRRDVPDVER